MPAQFIRCDFKPNTKPYTYRNDGRPVCVGDRVRVQDWRGDGWKAVTVVEVDVPEPTDFECKPILGRVEDAPAADPLPIERPQANLNDTVDGDAGEDPLERLLGG